MEGGRGGRLRRPSAPSCSRRNRRAVDSICEKEEIAGVKDESKTQLSEISELKKKEKVQTSAIAELRRSGSQQEVKIFELKQVAGRSERDMRKLSSAVTVLHTQAHSSDIARVHLEHRLYLVANREKQCLHFHGGGAWLRLLQ